MPNPTYAQVTNKNLSCGQEDTCPAGQCCSREIRRYMDGTDPIRTQGMQAKGSQVTNTYTNTQESIEWITFTAFNLRAEPADECASWK